MNVGVVVYCRALDYLGCRTHLDERRLLALDPSLDLEGVRAALKGVDAVCCGGERAGQAAAEPPVGWFRWLTAPRSTIVQPGPVHAASPPTPPPSWSGCSGSSSSSPTPSGCRGSRRPCRTR